MKKFVFTLQAVYDLALSTEEQQKIKLKQLENLINALKAELEEQKSAYLDAKDHCAEEMKQGLSSERMTHYSMYFESLINAMIKQKERILRTEEEREQWIQARIKTRTEIKTLEKLREAQYEEYLFEEKQEAEKEISDIVSFRTAVK